MIRFGFIFLAIILFGFPSETKAADLSGKRVEIIVPAGAGGGLTRNARAMAKNFSKHIPGNPTVVVKNIVGGGGQKGINFVYNKGKKDGTQILFGPLNFVGLNIGLPGIKYKAKDFHVIGMCCGTPFTTIVRKDIKGGIDSREDIVNKSGFVTGGRIPGGNLGLFSRMPFAMLGIKNRFVVGYKNQPKLKAAMLQNEIQALTTGNPGYFAFYVNDTLKKGDGIALFTHPTLDQKTGEPRPVTHMTGVPTFLDYYAKVKGGKPSGDAWEAYKWKATYDQWTMSMYLPPGTPKNVVGAMRKAWKDNWSDPATQALYKKGNKTLPILLQGADADAILNNFKSMPEGAKKYFAVETGIAKKNRKKKKK